MCHDVFVAKTKHPRKRLTNVLHVQIADTKLFEWVHEHKRESGLPIRAILVKALKLYQIGYTK